MKIVTEIKNAFESARDEKIAQGQQAYMKDKFPFLGIKTTERRQMQKVVFANHSVESPDQLIETAYKLWNLEEREYQYAAAELLDKGRKHLSSEHLPFLKNLVGDKSWWDTVDFLAAHIVGGIIAKNISHLKEMDIWITDEDFWIRRTALLSQLKWKDKTDSVRLFKYCTQTMHEKEFFIRKAIGWVLREYSKTHPEEVRKFVEENKNHLSGLSIREASKYI